MIFSDYRRFVGSKRLYLNLSTKPVMYILRTYRLSKATTNSNVNIIYFALFILEDEASTMP
jgi:hypothetical protein